MFIAFEGIDGSGKSTVSSRVAKMLRARGIPVEHVREDGSYASPLVDRMREFLKDTRNLLMTPEAELLTNVAREVQLISECIQPALERGALVIADRCLYSHAALAMYGRGMPAEHVHTLMAAAAAGAWPDVVILMDVDPYIARARRRTSKLAKKAQAAKSGDQAVRTGVSGSRKNLQGAGLQHRLRDGYLDMARRDSERWMVVDNSDPLNPATALYAVVADLADTIAARWARSQRSAPPPAASQTSPRGKSKSDAGRRINVRPATLELTPIPELNDFESAYRAFFDNVRMRAHREIEVAAYFLARLDDDVSWQLRELWAPRAPHAVAYGLRGLSGERAWAMREYLAEASPVHVVHSLGGRTADDERAWHLRSLFADALPADVLATITRDQSDDAWRLRERLWDRDPAAVVGSLAYIESDRAWDMRERFRTRLEAQSDPLPGDITKLIKSVTGLADARSWEIRERYLDHWPIAVLESLSSITDERSWGVRERFVAHAPKTIMGTFNRSSDPRAWRLRARYAPWVKEALDSMTGSDEPEAWQIRDECLDIWPSTVVKSLATLGLGERGRAMTLSALQRHPTNISLLKHVARLVHLERTKHDQGTTHAS